MSFILRFRQRIAEWARNIFQEALHEAERAEASRLYRIYEAEKAKCEEYSNEDTALLMDARLWLDHPQRMLPEHVAECALRMREHSGRSPFERSTLVDEGKKLSMPRMQELHGEVFNTIFWGLALWGNIRSLMGRQRDYIEFKTWQIRGGLLMGDASMAKSSAENILNQLSKYKTPAMVFTEAMDTLEQKYGPFDEEDNPERSR